jgi:hypothetical protein
MNEVTVPISAVRKSVTVPIAPERAFELFISEIGTWWPLATHSVGLERAIGVSCGTSVGDEMVETLDDGTTSVWGTVLESDPLHLIVLSWHAGRSADDATRLELVFDRGRSRRRSVVSVAAMPDTVRDCRASAGACPPG